MTTPPGKPKRFPKTPSENSDLGSTGDPPVPSGDSPDGIASASAAHPDTRSPAATSPIPLGGSPTGAGGSPALPIFQTATKHHLLYAIFFLSGICGLGYQLVWSRLFAIGLGHELPGVLAVVAAFFGGLALGAWMLDQRVSRSPRPGRWYGGLEILIGLWGILSAALIPLANPMALTLIGLEPSTFRHWSVAFLVPFFVLLPATTALGATFPAMERCVSRIESNGRCVAKLYAANTLGAVTGTLISTLVLLPAFGFTATLFMLATLNLLCGAVVWVVGDGLPSRTVGGSIASQVAKSRPENSVLGSTGYQPVPSGDSPDGMASAPAANLDARFPTSTSPIPVGGSPTGAGESPAPPIFQTGSNVSQNLRVTDPRSGARLCEAQHAQSMQMPRDRIGMDTLADPPSDIPVWRLNLTLFLTGVFGIGYEVLGVRVMAEVLENTIYSFTAALSVYLLGTALGAAVYERFAKHRDFQMVLGRLLSGIGVTCLVGAWTLSKAQPVYEKMRAAFGDSLSAVLAAEMAVSAIVFGLPTLFMGATFSHLVQQARRVGGGVGRAVALNTLGSALAPVLFGVWLLPAMGAKWTLALVSLGYFLLLVINSRNADGGKLAVPSSQAAVGDPQLKRSFTRRIAMLDWRWLTAALAFGLFLALPERLQFVQKPPGGAILDYRQGVMDSVAVVKHFDGHRSLLVNNRFTMGGTGAANATRRHAHLPLLLHPKPERALFLGLGTAITFAAAGAYPDLQADGVELVPEILDVLPFFEPENALRPGLKLYAADARRFVRASTVSYDVIVADLFHPARDGAGALYTIEHYQAIRGRLKPDGLFCQWLPLFQLDEPMLRVIIRTFLEVFPHSRAYLLRFNVDLPVLGLVATLEPMRYSTDWFERRVQDAALLKQLKALPLGDRLQLFGGLVADARALREFSRDAALNTDNHPVVTFEAPRFAFQRGQTSYGRLFALLDQCQTDPRELVQLEGDPAGEKFVQELERFIAARNVYLHGLAAESEGRLAQAIDAFVESARLSPDFTTGYAHVLTRAVQESKANPDTARRLLQRLIEVQPARPVARELLQRLFPSAEKSP
jgi:spermidine synthase